MRFELLHEQTGFAAIVGIDSAQVVSVYYPAQGTAAAPYSPELSELSGAVELDDTMGSETYYGLYSAAPFDAKQVGVKLLVHQPISDEIRVTEVTVRKTPAP